MLKCVDFCMVQIDDTEAKAAFFSRGSKVTPSQPLISLQEGVLLVVGAVLVAEAHFMQSYSLRQGFTWWRPGLRGRQT